MHSTREGWLVAAMAELKPLLDKAGLKLPGKVKVSCGWPGTANRKKAIGECWVKDRQIFISPKISSERGDQGVLSVLLHEMIHAALPDGTGHKAPFKRAMEAVGLEGKAKTSKAGAELDGGLFKKIVKELGPYPHKSLALGGGDGKKQTTRLLKMECQECGLTVRITKKWIDELEAKGTPAACWLCDGTMGYEIQEDEGE